MNKNFGSGGDKSSDDLKIEALQKRLSEKLLNMNGPEDELELLEILDQLEKLKSIPPGEQEEMERQMKERFDEMLLSDGAPLMETEKKTKPNSDTGEEAAAMEIEPPVPVKRPGSKKNGRRFRIPLAGSAAAAVVVLLFFGWRFAPDTIAEFNPLETKREVQDEYVQNRPGGHFDLDTGRYNSFRDIEEEIGRPVFQVEYIPEGYVWGGIEKFDYDDAQYYYVTYISDNGPEIVYELKVLTGGLHFPDDWLEKDPDISNYDVIVVEDVEIIYYPNYEWYQVQWENDNVHYKMHNLPSAEEARAFIQGLVYNG